MLFVIFSYCAANQGKARAMEGDKVAREGMDDGLDGGLVELDTEEDMLDGLNAEGLVELNETLDTLAAIAGHLEHSSQRLEADLTHTLEAIRAQRQPRGQEHNEHSQPSSGHEGERPHAQPQKQAQDGDGEVEAGTRGDAAAAAFQQLATMMASMQTAQAGEAEGAALSLEQLRAKLREVAHLQGGDDDDAGGDDDDDDDDAGACDEEKQQSKRCD